MGSSGLPLPESSRPGLRVCPSASHSRSHCANAWYCNDPQNRPLVADIGNGRLLSQVFTQNLDFLLAQKPSTVLFHGHFPSKITVSNKIPGNVQFQLRHYKSGRPRRFRDDTSLLPIGATGPARASAERKRQGNANGFCCKSVANAFSRLKSVDSGCWKLLHYSHLETWAPVAQ